MIPTGFSVNSADDTTFEKQPKTHTIALVNGLPIGHATPPLYPGNGYRVTQRWQP